MRMDFSLALNCLKKGEHVTREGWNGPGQYVYMTANEVRSEFGNGRQYTIAPHLVIKTVQGTHVPWLASQTDLLAEDWIIVDAEADEE